MTHCDFEWDLTLTWTTRRRSRSITNNTCRKLGLATRSDIVRYALETGLLSQGKIPDVRAEQQLPLFAWTPDGIRPDTPD